MSQEPGTPPPLPGPVPPIEYRRRRDRHTASWVFYGVFFAVVWNLGPVVIRERGG